MAARNKNSPEADDIIYSFSSPLSNVLQRAVDVHAGRRLAPALDEQEDEVCDFSGYVDTVTSPVRSASVRPPVPAKVPTRSDSSVSEDGLTAQQRKQQAAAARKLAKQADKQAAAMQRVVQRAARGGFRKEELAIVLESSLDGSELGAALNAAFAEAGYHVLSPVDASHTLTHIAGARHAPAEVVAMLRHSIHWRRRGVDVSVCAPGRVAFTDNASVEPFVALIVDGCTFVEKLMAEGTDGVEEEHVKLLSVLPHGFRILYIIRGARSAIEQSLARARGGGKGAISPDGYDAALMHLYVTAGMEIKDTNSDPELVEYVLGVSRSVSEKPYKMHATALAVVTKVKVPRMGSAAAAMDGAETGALDEDAPAPVEPSTGKRTRDMWYAMLQMIPGVSSAKAAQIVKEYPSLTSLVRRYRDPRLSETDKERLLEEIGTSAAGRRMTKGSREIYRFFSTRDSETMIGAGE